MHRDPLGKKSGTDRTPPSHFIFSFFFYLISQSRSHSVMFTPIRITCLPPVSSLFAPFTRNLHPPFRSHSHSALTPTRTHLQPSPPQSPLFNHFPSLSNPTKQSNKPQQFIAHAANNINRSFPLVCKNQHLLPSRKQCQLQS